MPHTPRLCIDARAGRDFSQQGGSLAEEVVDQLVAAIGEGKTSSPWLEKSRTVLVAHPSQLFSGQLKRFDTRRRIGRSPFYRLWERRLVQHGKMTLFHRFRPIDRLGPIHPDCPTITTLLPPVSKLPTRIAAGQAFVVPSHQDSNLLAQRYGVPRAQIYVVRPTIRRALHYAPQPPGNGPLEYSVKLPFDWGVPALEALFWGRSVRFPEEHGALSELLPAAVRFSTESARLELFKAGVFNPLGFAEQYRHVYDQVSGVKTWPEGGGGCCASLPN